jgi:molybdopterin synthase sulfur carrier subunit
MTDTVSLKFFASIREQIGLSDQSLALSQPCAVGVIRAQLAARGGAWERSLGSQQRVLVAVNQEVVDETTLVHPGDELAFFPPVTGG